MTQIGMFGDSSSYVTNHEVLLLFAIADDI